MTADRHIIGDKYYVLYILILILIVRDIQTVLRVDDDPVESSLAHAAADAARPGAAAAVAGRRCREFVTGAPLLSSSSLLLFITGGALHFVVAEAVQLGSAVACRPLTEAGRRASNPWVVQVLPVCLSIAIERIFFALCRIFVTFLRIFRRSDRNSASAARIRNSD